MVFLYNYSYATTAQIKRTLQSGDPKQGWYSCTLQAKSGEMSVNNYVEIYNHRKEGNYYNLYNHDGYFLWFAPEKSKLILGNLTEGIQFQDNINFKKYDDNSYLLEFEEGAIEIQVHDKLSLSVNCNIGKSPPLRRIETRPKYWTLNYSFHSDFVFFDNGCSSQLPTPGSSISFSWSNYGHVAIVRRVEVLSDEIVLLHLF